MIVKEWKLCLFLNFFVMMMIVFMEVESQITPSLFPPPPPVSGLVTEIPEGAIRLVGGSSEDQGRLEIYHDGEWGTVCDDSFTVTDGNVVCRQLGFGIASSIISLGGGGDSSSTPEGEDGFDIGSGTIWLDDVGCTGSESTLSSCRHGGWGVHNCEHHEDVGIICTEQVAGEASCSIPQLQDDVRILTQGISRNIPVSHGTNVSFGCGSRYNLEGHGENIRCSDGSWDYWNEGRWNEANIGSFICLRIAEGAIRLVGGTSEDQGRLEIYHDGEWGTVCDDSFTITDGNVVCRQLGFGMASSISSLETVDQGFDVGSGSIWLDDVDCAGSESTLDSCSHGGWGVHNCGHNEDVGIICTEQVVGEGCSDQYIQLMLDNCRDDFTHPTIFDRERATWIMGIFNTKQQMQNIFLYRVELDIIKLTRQAELAIGPSHEFEIEITSNSISPNLSILITYEANVESNFPAGQLQHPLSLSPNDEVSISVRYTPDSLNQSYEIVYSSCNECVTAHVFRLRTLDDCDDADNKRCLDNFYTWNSSASAAPTCTTEEYAQLYRSVFENRCLDGPKLIFIESDQRAKIGEMVELRCIVEGVPPPMVRWVTADDNREIPANHPLNSAAYMEVEVTENVKKYYCKYSNTVGYGTSNEVTVQALPEMCIEHIVNEEDLLRDNQNGCLSPPRSPGNPQGFNIFKETDDMLPFIIFRFRLSIRPLTNAVAYAVSVQTRFFERLRQNYPTSFLVGSFKLVMKRGTLFNRAFVFADRPQREIELLLHSQLYDNITLLTSNPFVIFPLNSPVNLRSEVGFSDEDIIVEITVLNDEQVPQNEINEIDGYAVLNITTCLDYETIKDRIYEGDGYPEFYGIDCNMFYRLWTEETSQQCETRVDLYKAYQTCVGIYEVSE